MLNDNTHINYSKADIEKYLQGKMSASEMHALEKAALQDPFLADAIEGFEIADTIKSNNALAKTEAMILESTTQKEYSLNDIEQYYSGSLTNAERYALEKAALQDPFLADAMEGYEKVNFATVQQRLQTITHNITSTKEEETKVVVMQSSSNKQWLRYAAAIILMVGVGSTVWLINKKATTVEQSIAQVHEEVKNAPSATVQNPSIKTNKVTTDVATGPKKEALENTKPFSDIKPSTSTTAAAVIDNKQEQLVAQEKTNDALAGKIAGVKVEEAKTKEQQEILARKNATSKNATLENKDFQNATANAGNANRSNDSNISPSVSNNSRNYSYNSNNTPLNVIKGRVTDDKGEAIPAANINIKTNNQNFIALSDNKGNFSVKTADTNAIASIQSIGYEKRELRLSANTSNNVVLNKENESLAEVVVVGYGAAKKKSMSTGAVSKTANQEIINSGATPIGGWKSFNDYLQQKIAEVLNDKKEEDGDFRDVTVEFKVDENGKPYSIKTLGTNNKALSQKAIEIIKEGPKWQADKKSKKVKLVLQF